MNQFRVHCSQVNYFTVLVDAETAEDERIEITNDHLGVWEAADEDDLIEEVTTASGWCIKKIDYDIQLK